MGETSDLLDVGLSETELGAMFEKVFYSIAHFVFILHLLFACVLWLRAHGSARLRALALLMGLLALFSFLKLWAFGLQLLPLDLRPSLGGGLLTMILCLVPRLRFSSPGEIFRGRLYILAPALFPFVLYGVALLFGVQFQTVESTSEVFAQIARPDVWVRLAMSLPVFWYAIRSFRILRRMGDAHLSDLYAWSCLLLIPCFFVVALDGSMLSQLCVQLYFLLFNGQVVYSALFDKDAPTAPDAPKPSSAPSDRAEEDAAESVRRQDGGEGRSDEPAFGHDVPEHPAVAEQPTVVVARNPLFERLEHYMHHEEPWRNPELTLADVVTHLYTNRTTLTQVIREAGYGGFKDYVGFYRIREFKRLVGQGKVESLEQGFRMVGFRSKTTAFRHFSRLEQMTPMEYLRNNAPLDSLCED